MNVTSVEKNVINAYRDHVFRICPHSTTASQDNRVSFGVVGLRYRTRLHEPKSRRDDLPVCIIALWAFSESDQTRTKDGIETQLLTISSTQP